MRLQAGRASICHSLDFAVVAGAPAKLRPSMQRLHIKVPRSTKVYQGPPSKLFGKQSPIGMGAADGFTGRPPVAVPVEGSQNTGGVLTLAVGARRSTRILAVTTAGAARWSMHLPRRDGDAKDKAERPAPTTN